MGVKQVGNDDSHKSVPNEPFYLTGTDTPTPLTRTHFDLFNLLTFLWKVMFSYISPEADVPSPDELDDKRSVSVAFFELA